MLVINDAQMKTLSRAVFETWMLEHLRTVFPEACNELGDAGLRREIKRSIEKANQHGFDCERDLALFVDLVFLLGQDFDQDPRMAWAGQILNDLSLTDNASRMDVLYDAAIEYLSKDSRVAGLDS